MAERGVAGGIGGAAEGEPVGEQVAQVWVDDLVGGALGGEDDDDACGATALWPIGPAIGGDGQSSE